jgi:hypothetical protein
VRLPEREAEKAVSKYLRTGSICERSGELGAAKDRETDARSDPASVPKPESSLKNIFFAKIAIWHTYNPIIAFLIYSL